MMQKETRPRIRPELRMLDHVFRMLALAGAGGLAATLVALLIAPNFLPGRVPLHFGLNGQPDRWGSVRELMLVPVVALALYALLTFVARIPHHYNYPVAITPQNAERQYALARRLIFALRAILVWLFLALFWLARQVAVGEASGLSPFFFILSTGTIGACITWYLVAAVRAR